MKIKWLDRRIAAPAPYLTLCTSEAQFVQALKDCGIKQAPDWIKTPTAHATCHYLTSGKSEAVCIVCIDVAPERDPIEIAGLLVHEAVHVVQDYFRRIGEHEPATEQYAYAVQSVSQELMAAYSETLK